MGRRVAMNHKTYELSCYTQEYTEGSVERYTPPWWKFWRNEQVLIYDSTVKHVKHSVVLEQEEADFLMGKCFRDLEVILVTKALCGTDLCSDILLTENPEGIKNLLQKH